MSKERLDFDVEREMNRLKKIVNKDDSFTLTSRFVKHLIEQAERVQELEKRIKIYQKRSWFEEYEKVVKQNKRYREALEQIIKDECNMGRKGMWAEKEARHALEDVDNGK